MDAGVAEADTSSRCSQTTTIRMIVWRKKATYSICALASSSPWASRAILGRYLMVVSSAHFEKISEIGLDPW